jgi:hypothetical protein
MTKSNRPRATWLSQPKPRRGRPPRVFEYIDPPTLARTRPRYTLMRELLQEIEYGTSEARLYAGLLAQHLLAKHPKLEPKFRYELRRLAFSISRPREDAD